MKIIFNDILEINCRITNFRSKYAFKLLKLQCDTFKMKIPINESTPLIIFISLSDKKEISWDGNILNLGITKAADMSLAFLIQLWAIHNDGLVFHGALLKQNDYGIILTGNGGVGKTFLSLKHCRLTNEDFAGDDLVYFKKLKLYPILRPLCIYPEHLQLRVNKYSIRRNGKIISLNSFTLRSIRKILLLLAVEIRVFELLFLQVLSHSTSSKAYAYVEPSALGLKVVNDPLECKGLISIIKHDDGERAITNDVNVAIMGTKSEYSSFKFYLDYFTNSIQSLPTFEQYLIQKIDDCRRFNSNDTYQKIEKLVKTE